MTAINTENRQLANTLIIDYEKVLSQLLQVRVKLVVVAEDSTPTKELIKKLDGFNPNIDFVVNTIFLVILEKTKVTRCKLESKSREKDLVNLRPILFSMMRRYTSLSFKTIGDKAGGGRDHSTVMHGIQNYEDWMITDKSFARLATEIEHRFKEITLNEQLKTNNHDTN